MAVWQFASVESRGEYELAYQTKKYLIDPRISGPTRMGRADEVSAAAYRKTLELRKSLIHQYRNEIGHKIVLLPTVAMVPPRFSDLENDDEYSRINLKVLRNTSMGNVMDCCSIPLPFSASDTTIGVMLSACVDHDLSLLRLADECEMILKA